MERPSRIVERMMAHEFDGTVVRRGDEGYEAARRAALWNAKTPARYPDVIVLAETQDDAVRAVALARAERHTIGVRSGGHSWAGNHVRDGGLLLDLSRLRAFSIDPAARTASLQPGLPGHELIAALEPHGLFFPAGHCVGVGLGGYLLQGGFGWNGRAYGPACAQVLALDVITADGELVRADPDTNTDLYWAARGAGPGFFGIVTRFHVRLHERPAVIANGVYLYPIDVLDDVFRWAHEIQPRVPATMELMLVVHHDHEGELEIAVTGPVFADTEAQAAEALALLQTCPVLHRAKLALPHVPGRMEDLYAGVHAAYPDEHRYCADNMWTHAPVEDLLPGIRAAITTMPPAPSHLLWMNWSPGTQSAPPRPDMAYSVEDDTYIAVYAVWQDEADDDRCVAWATDHMRAMEDHASGIQLADENLDRRPARFVRDEHLERLDAIRADRDPEGRFHEWMGRPA